MFGFFKLVPAYPNASLFSQILLSTGQLRASFQLLSIWLGIVILESSL